jgi:DNA-binding MarR family transcriptional regulator
MIDKTTTTKAVKKLEDEGYIYRIKDLEDKRYYKLYITEKGNEFRPVLRKILDQVTATLDNSMSDKEYFESLKSFKLILENAKNAVENLRNEG